MRRLFWIPLFFICSFSEAKPRHNYPDTTDKIWQNDLDLSNDISQSNLELKSKTLTELRTMAPVRVGIQYYCSNCATAAVCVSTGTAVGGFSSMAARTTACN